MAQKGTPGPKGSEIPCEEWLTQIGAIDVCYTGAAGTPPDFVIDYRGDPIAVEVTLLHDQDGWPRAVETAVERALERVIEEVSDEVEDSPNWHVRCEYDPEQPAGSMRDVAWKERARKLLRRPGPGGEFPLLAPARVRGRGVVLTLLPSSQASTLHPVCPDMGGRVVASLIERIAAEVRRKTRKVQKAPGYYDRWWLVFDDEMLIAPFSVLSPDERRKIETAVRECDGRDQWSKIVLMSRYQLTPPLPKRDKWFHPLWEDERSPPLPVSPV